MKKKVVTFALGGMLFSLAGCYTHICPTYSVKPEQKPTQEVVQKQLKDQLEKAS